MGTTNNNSAASPSGVSRSCAMPSRPARRNEVKEPDCAALRKREGFQKLVAELETKQKAPGAADSNGFLCREARQRGDVKATNA
jgi:hypothetical protein